MYVMEILHVIILHYAEIIEFGERKILCPYVNLALRV